MKNYILLISMCIVHTAYSCDFCGCYMGITHYDNQSSITMMYRYKSYNGYNFTTQNHELFPQKSYPAYNAGGTTNYNTNYTAKHGTAAGAVDTRSQRDYELYTTAELRAKYYIHKRIELNAIVPYLINSSLTNGEQQAVKHIGDVTLFAGYHLISKIAEEKFQHRLIIGAGVKLPVGDYKAASEDGDRFDFLLQSGTGSVDYMGYLNYIFGYKKIGVNLNAVYKLNGTNSLGERIENSNSGTLNVFLKLRNDKNLKVFPSLQSYFEHTAGVYINNRYEPGTRTNVMMCGAGLDLFYKNICLNTSFQLPVYEQKFENNLTLAGRFMIGLTYSFNQNNYLIKSKPKN